MRSRFKHVESTHMTLSIPVEMKYHIEQIAAHRDMSASALCRELFRKEIAQNEVCENPRSGNR